MNTKLDEILTQALLEIDNATTFLKLNEIRAFYTGKKSPLAEIMKTLSNATIEDKKRIGAASNNVKQQIEKALCNKKIQLEETEINEKLKAETIDVTMPGYETRQGSIHPLNKVIEELEDIFTGMGYSIAEGPEVEIDVFNFEMLNVPKGHPARDMQDTFYTNVGKNVVLRSQTSNSQIRAMINKRPPIKIISPGRVYRSEAVSARKNNLFHQIEGLLIDKNITFGDLKGTLNEFIRLYFGGNRKTRFRNSFFPFTEPSAEVDVECIMCNGKGCRVCSGLGWLEVLGAGMVDPNVLENMHIDTNQYAGFAFGMGVERLAMLKWAIDDIRLFYNNDIRFLKQF